jgi:hypothetical protein
MTALIIGVTDKTQQSTGNSQGVTASNPICAVSGMVGKDGITSADSIHRNNETHWKLAVFLQYRAGEN